LESAPTAALNFLPAVLVVVAVIWLPLKPPTKEASMDVLAEAAAAAVEAESPPPREDELLFSILLFRGLRMREAE